MWSATVISTVSNMNVALLAGSTSTVLFAVSYLPMLLKAARTKDLTSYSLGNITMSNLANLVHSIYVFSLPIGPIWFLHSFYLATSALMLVWFIRFRTETHHGATLMHVTEQKARP